MLYVLADAHAGTVPTEDRALLALLDALAPGELVILGDLFRAFVGLPKYWSPEQRDVLEALARFRSRGGRVRFVVGNREYLVGAERGLPFDDVIPDRSIVELAGRPTLICHGDRIDPRDLGYRAWYRLSRSSAASLALRALPGFVGRSLARRTEAALARTNRSYKAGPLPLAALEALGREAASRGAAQALVGHFHRDETLRVPGGAPVQLAPPWLEHQRLLIADPDGALISVRPDQLPGEATWKLG